MKAKPGRPEISRKMTSSQTTYLRGSSTDSETGKPSGGTSWIGTPSRLSTSRGIRPSTTSAKRLNPSPMNPNRPSTTAEGITPSKLSVSPTSTSGSRPSPKSITTPTANKHKPKKKMAAANSSPPCPKISPPPSPTALTLKPRNSNRPTSTTSS